MKATNPYVRLGQDIKCDICGRIFSRASCNQKYCSDCAIERHRQRGIERRRRRRAESRKYKLMDLPKLESEQYLKEVIGYTQRCSFCGRMPSNKTVVSTEIIDRYKWWRCICRPAEAQLWEKAITN